jgi:hypothetical protein
MYCTYRTYRRRYWDFLWYPCTVCLSGIAPKLNAVGPKGYSAHKSSRSTTKPRNYVKC